MMKIDWISQTTRWSKNSKRTRGLSKNLSEYQIMYPNQNTTI